MAPLTRPPALRPGDTIGICTPSFPAHVAFRAKYLHGIAELTRLGFRVVEGELTARATAQGARAGTPRKRADEINALFANPEVRGIMTTIGGSNSSSLVPYLDFDLVRAHPKVFCGSSDVTSLHLALMRHAGLARGALNRSTLYERLSRPKGSRGVSDEAFEQEASPS